ncbi:MAG: hypothetical protein SCALA702_30650 [Melioribacteraceae bacterium]|nr:MAG: hypothetical protein SCALA702_30650 [Melioribacteraceae bacterium]
MFKHKLNIKIPTLRELLRRDTLKRYFSKFIGLKASPHKLAWSVAIGVFIGFFIPIGFQSFFIIPLALALEVNLIVAYISTLVSNPITAIPMYYVAVNVGQRLTGIEVLWSNFEKVFSEFSFSALMNLGTDSLIVFFTGSLFLGLIFAALLYIFTYKVVSYYRKTTNLYSP